MTTQTSETPAAGHEFTEADNAVFLEMARAARFVGAAGAVLAALLVVGGATSLIYAPLHLPPRAALIVGALTMVVGFPAGAAGWRLLSAAGAVRRVATTAGHDVGHLMDAVRWLRHAFIGLAVMLLVDVGVLAAVVLVMFPRGA